MRGSNRPTVPRAAVIVWLVLFAPGVRGADPADWPTYNHDPAGWRFNPAETTLDPANVGKLVERWRFPAADSRETIGVVHATPTVVAGAGTDRRPGDGDLGRPDGRALAARAPDHPRDGRHAR